MEVEGVAQALRFRSSLNELDLDNINLTVMGFKAIGRILQQCLSLTILTVWDQDLVLDTAMAAALAKGIKRTLSLKKLRISGRSIPMAAGCLILDALPHNRTLTCVELVGIELGHDGSVSVAHLIERDDTIEDLVLDGGGIGTGSRTTAYLAPIVRALLSNRTLQSLDLDSMCLRMDGIQSVCSTSLRNSTLEILGLDNCRIEVEEESPLIFHACFRLVSALTILDINSCAIGDDLFVPLIDACKGLTYLEELELTGLNIEDSRASALALAALLEESQTLQRLKIPGYLIEEDENRALLDSVRSNYSLTELDGLALSRAQLYELQFYLDRNGGAAHLVGATVPLALWPHALSQAACYRNRWDESFRESGSDSESEDDSEVHQQGPDMLYFLVREMCHEIFRNVPTRRRRSKRKRSGYRGRRTRRRGG